MLASKCVGKHYPSKVGYGKKIFRRECKCLEIFRLRANAARVERVFHGSGNPFENVRAKRIFIDRNISKKSVFL